VRSSAGPAAAVFGLRRGGGPPAIRHTLRVGGLAINILALHIVDHDLAAQFFNERFRAAIAYYPYCDISRQR
jgi:hypothetical protein